MSTRQPPSGCGHELLTNAQMAQADALTAQGAGPSAWQLMLNAGLAVARCIQQRWAPQPTLVACGPGNNGGDGYVVARYLHEWGWPVRLIAWGDPGFLQGEAAEHAALWQGPTHPWGGNALQGVTLLVDAVFGAGLSRGLPDAVGEVLQQAVRQGAQLCAIDVPSGLHGTDGCVDVATVPAHLTVTFFRAKPGHYLYPGRDYCGELVVADIGIPDHAAAVATPPQWRNEPALWRGQLPAILNTGHKYHRGHVLVLGGLQLTGAARLAAQAAQRAGAGLVTVAAPRPVWSVYATALQSVMVEPCDTAESGLPAGCGTSWLDALADSRRNVVLLGPGLGRHASHAGHVLQALGVQPARAVVLDADALWGFGERPDTLFQAIQGACVLTPHEGEFQRLFGSLSGSKLERARQAARASSAVVVLKGADTVVAAPDGRAVINHNAPPWLATGGTGDVLAGLVAGLLAQGVEAFASSAIAVWMQGRAGQRLGRGLVADDLLAELPRVWQDLRTA